MVINTLQKRLILLILLPVTLLLLLVGIFGFVYMRGALFSEWQEMSIVKLQRAAHLIDMRLGRIASWLELFEHTSEGRGGPIIQEWILQQLRDMEGVENVEMKLEDDRDTETPMMMRMGGRGSGGGRMMRFSRAKPFEVTSPEFDTGSGEETVHLISLLKDASDKVVGTLDVSVRFEYLLKGVKAQGWWQTEQACLIDEDGDYLCHTKLVMKKGIIFGGTDDPFERALFDAIQQKPYGTVLGPGRPPETVGGFYRLKYAPWAIVLFAEGDKVLKPIIHFRNYYFAGGLLAI